MTARKAKAKAKAKAKGKAKARTTVGFGGLGSPPMSTMKLPVWMGHPVDAAAGVDGPPGGFGGGLVRRQVSFR
jgi:hypothetical protein